MGNLIKNHEKLRSKFYLFISIILIGTLQANAQYIFEYEDIKSNDEIAIMSVKYAHIESESSDTLVKQVIKYHYSKSNLLDSANVLDLASKNFTTIKYRYKGEMLCEKSFYNNDSIFRTIKYKNKGKKTYEKKYAFNEKGEFRLCCIEKTIRVSDNLTITKERYLWSKKNLKYYLLGFNNRIWKFHNDKTDFTYFESIQTNQSKGKSKIYRQWINENMSFELSVRENTNQIIESHIVFFDNYGNMNMSELQLDGKAVSTTLYLIEYKKNCP